MKEQKTVNLAAVVRHYRTNFRGKAHEQLDSFRAEATLQDAVLRAALAEDESGKRYSHQRRLKRQHLSAAAERLDNQLERIEVATNFAKLFDIVRETVRPLAGLGELYVYDTALRIGAKTGVLPTRVYLHRGTRTGARALHLDAKRRVALDLVDLRDAGAGALCDLEPHEIEDVLCIYKKHFKGEADLEDASACWADDDPEGH